MNREGPRPRRPSRLPIRIAAGAVWPAAAPPIPNGAVLVDRAGRLLAVGPAAMVPRPADAATAAYPDAVLLPGLINLHTHLELHTWRGAVPEDDFFEWIQHVRRLKDEASEDAFRAGAREGVLEAWAYGTTTVVDSGTTGATVAALTELGGRGVYYHEVIAPDPSAADRALGTATARAGALREQAGAGVTIGLSPHAPYTVSPDLARAIAARARAASLPLAGHLAESQAEAEFVTVGRGPFADHWRRRGLSLSGRWRSPVAWADALGLLGPDFLAIHAVQLDQEDVTCLARAGAAVAACLGSNRRHGHGDPPLAALLDAGVRVGLGTDSVASVAALDLFAEARAAQALAGLTAGAALRLVTVDAARALGRTDLGALVPGAWADLCVVRRPAPGGAGDPLDATLGAGRGAVLATYVAGRQVFGAES